MNQHLLSSKTGGCRTLEAPFAENLCQPPGKPGQALQKERQTSPRGEWCKRVAGVGVFLLLLFFASNAFAAISGAGFSPANLLHDVKWNADENCLEFTVMVQDDWGDGLNEWIENAYVYIDGQNVFDIGGPAYNAALMKWRMYESNGKTVRPTAKYLSAHRDNQPLSVVVRLRG